MNTIHNGDCLAVLRTMPDCSVHCVVTSPPYYALRDYGTDGQIGLEATPELYVARMVEVFREVRRVLRDDGTLWLNIGDSYANDAKGPNGKPGPGLQGAANGEMPRKCWRGSDLKKKDLIGIPWMLAFALRADGWYLRQEIIWAKPSPMPESVTDRCTKAHEQVFLLAKSPQYFFDARAIAEPIVRGAAGSSFAAGKTGRHQLERVSSKPRVEGDSRNKRSVWRIASVPYKGAHFATFPPKLVQPCILAGTSARGVCPECGAPWVRQTAKTRRATRPGTDSKVTAKHEGDGRTASTAGWNRANVVGNRDPQRHCTITTTTGWQSSCQCPAAEPTGAVVLDPFAGSGTTAATAAELGCKSVSIELNADYCELIRRRLEIVTPPLFAGVA